MKSSGCTPDILGRSSKCKERSIVVVFYMVKLSRIVYMKRPDLLFLEAGAPQEVILWLYPMRRRAHLLLLNALWLSSVPDRVMT